MILGALVLLGGACSSTADEGDSMALTFGGFGTDDGEADGGSTSGRPDSADGGVTSEPPADSLDDTAGPIFDVNGDGEAGATGGVEGCQKIDFLFAIDNSGTMYDKQQRLLDAFPGFIDAIRNDVQGQDHHIMVVDSDERPTVGYCEVPACPMTFCDGYACQSWDTLGLGPCDETLGAGVVEPHGGSASNMDCGFPPERRYLTDTDADLDSKFACAAQVGQSGNGSERPVTAAITALSGAQQAPGACNEGFLRDDALLVLTFISDDPPSAADDDATIGVAQQWYDALVAAKGGNADAIVVAGLMLYDDTSCHAFDVPAPPFIELVDLFGEHGVKASVCEVDYAAVFAEAVGIIDQACDDFGPGG